MDEWAEKLVNQWLIAGCAGPIDEAAYVIKVVFDQGNLKPTNLLAPPHTWTFLFSIYNVVEKWDRQVMHNVDVARLDLAIRLLYNDKKPADLIWKITTEAYGKHRVHSGLKEANK